MMPNVSIFGYLFVTILSIVGFLLLAMGSKKESLVLLNRQILTKEKVLFKSFGWAFLVVTFFVCIYLWYFSYGMFLYFGVLIFASLLVIVFIGFKAYKKEENFENKAYKDEKENLEDFKVWKIGVLVTLILLPLFVAYNLYTLPKHPLESENAIKDKIGEFEFVLAEHDSGAFEIADNGIAFMTFNIRFCEKCDMQIDDIFIKINKSLGEKSFGMQFHGNYWERESSVQVPFSLNENSEIWLTVVARNGQVYQKSFNIKENFTKSFKEFKDYSKNARLEIEW